MQIYNNSKVQAWPILLKVFDKDYITIKPFPVAVYCGDSKLADVNEFLEDFICEVQKLTENMITINQRNYTFKVKGLIADAQARSFLKCVKPPGLFYACERCEIKGESVRAKKWKKRIYSEIDAKKRTKSTFINKNQKKHHKENVTCSLNKLPDFDPVMDVVLDSMHLLFLGVMKSLLTRWVIDRSSMAQLKFSQIKIL